jgi:hypothetical protein
VREALENLDCGLLKRDPHGLLTSGPSDLRCQSVSFFSLESLNP